MIEKTQVQAAIQNGATIADIAAQNNVTWGVAAAEIDRFGIPRPNALKQTATDMLVAKYLGLIPEGTFTTHDELVRLPTGATMGLPANFSIQNIDLNRIFEHFHGPNGYVDPYCGLPTGGRILIVNSSETKAGRPRNFLATNIETLTPQTIETRFCNWMRPIQERFGFRVNAEWYFVLTIQRPYDKLVGGTYAHPYVEALFDRWVGQPLAQYSHRSPEQEPVFGLRTPFEMAWWAWSELTHSGLLKGLTEIAVTMESRNQSVVLRDDDVQNAILGYSMKDHGQGGSPLIVPASSMPSGKFDPGGLIGR